MRQRKNRAKSTIPTRNSKQAHHLLLWLNEENKNLKSQCDMNSENQIDEFHNLQQVWNQGILRKMLNCISVNNFRATFTSGYSIKSLSENSFEVEAGNMSSKSMKQHEKYVAMFAEIQSYLNEELGKSAAKGITPYLINVSKLASLVLYLCIQSDKRQQTAKIILSLPTETQEYLHNLIKQIERLMEPIKDYRGLLKAIENLEQQNGMLQSSLTEVNQTLQQKLQLIEIKDEEIKEVKQNLNQIERKALEVQRHFKVNDLEDTIEIYNELYQKYKEEIDYGELLVKENSELHREIQKFNIDMFNRNQVIVELNEQLEQSRKRIDFTQSHIQDEQLEVAEEVCKPIKAVEQTPEDFPFTLSGSGLFIGERNLLDNSLNLELTSKITKQCSNSTVEDFYNSGSSFNSQDRTIGLNLPPNSLKKTKLVSKLYGFQEDSTKKQNVSPLSVNNCLQNKMHRVFGSKFADISNKNTIKNFKAEILAHPSLMKTITTKCQQYYQQEEQNQTHLDDSINSLHELRFHTFDIQNKLASLQKEGERHQNKMAKIRELHKKFCEDMQIQTELAEP